MRHRIELINAFCDHNLHSGGKKNEQPQGFNLEKEYTEEDERRMDIIGQNGNEGTHYKKKEIFKESESIIPEMTELKDLKNKLSHPRIQEAIKHAKRAGDWKFQ